MSAGVGQAKLVDASRKFMQQWHAARQHWNDVAAERVQMELIDSLPTRIQAASNAMSQIAEIVHNAKRDCT